MHIVAFNDGFPKPLEIDCAQRTVVQPVARTALLAPDHPSMVRPDITVKARIVQRFENLIHIQRAVLRRMRRLIEIVFADKADIARMYKVHPPHACIFAKQGRDIVGRRGAERAGAERQPVPAGRMQGKKAVKIFLVCHNARQAKDIPRRIVRVDGLDKILSELKAQGRNLNQLTTLANMGKITVVYGDRLAESYQQISEQLRQLLREVT